MMSKTTVKECICGKKTPPYCDVCMPKNPLLKDDGCCCPHCKCELFYILDGNRHFCSECKRELRNNVNFKGGKLRN